MHDDPELIAAVRDAHARGLAAEEVFAVLGGRGVSKSAAIVYYARGTGVPDDEARRSVESSVLWDDHIEEQEAFHAAIERALFVDELTLEPDEEVLADPGGDEVVERQVRARAHLAEVAALLPDEVLAPYREANRRYAHAFAALVALGLEHGLPEDGWRGLEAAADALCLDEWEANLDQEELVIAARRFRARR